MQERSGYYTERELGYVRTDRSHIVWVWIPIQMLNSSGQRVRESLSRSIEGGTNEF
jgi:hypothetical protein